MKTIAMPMVNPAINSMGVCAFTLNLENATNAIEVKLIKSPKEEKKRGWSREK